MFICIMIFKKYTLLCFYTFLSIILIEQYLNSLEKIKRMILL